LLVFFPALLFGWLRERTGTIVGSTLFHAACNILSRVVAASVSPLWDAR
jgi:membrane protease YdiL (CAAX protease family)